VGQIELGSVGSNDFVDIKNTGNRWIFGYENAQNFHDIKVEKRLIERGSETFERRSSIRGEGGAIHVQGRSLSVTGASQIISVNQQATQGENIIVNASEEVIVSGSFFDPFLEFERVSAIGSPGTGNSGNTEIYTKRLIVEGGAAVATNSVIETGRAGDLIINAEESVLVRGTTASGQFPSGLFARGQGNSLPGNVTIDTNRLIIQDGAQILASNESGTAGTITIQNADSVILNGTSPILDSTSPDDIKRSGLFTTSRFGQGGNIKLENVNLLLLRNNSLITTDAGEFGTGGNIDIDADVIAAFPGENSDITANADQGSGGKIAITTQGIFGLEVRDQLTPLSDITAFSLNDPQLNGQVTINTPETDPSEGVVELPAIAPQTPQIAQSCRPGQALGGGSLVNLGRGGLPSNPRDTLTGQAVWEDLRSPVQPTASRQNQEPLPPVATIVEAQGWQRGPDGRVTLVPPADASSPQLPTPAC
jgi:large exoprotein involved in heme utilization and adhesion